jgi:hypothetical protein
MTDLDAIRDRYQHITAYVDAEKLLADLESDLADVRILAAHLKADYIAALEAEVARVKGDAPKAMPKPKATPATDAPIVCECGKTFDTQAQWRGHRTHCPARKTPAESHENPRAAFRGAVQTERGYVSPPPVVAETEPPPWECACGRPYTQSIADPSRCIKCVQEGRHP